MSAEIDKLEISISADSSQAAHNVAALADSLENLATSAGKAAEPTKQVADALSKLKAPSGFRKIVSAVDILSEAMKGLNNLELNIDANEINRKLQTISDATKRFNVSKTLPERTRVLRSALETVSGISYSANLDDVASQTRNLPTIAENISAIRVPKNVGEYAKRLQQSISAFESITLTGNLGRAADEIVNSVNKIENVNVDRSISNLERLTPMLERVANSLSNLSTASYSFENLSQQIQAFSFAFNSIARINLRDAGRIVEFIHTIQQAHFDSEFAENINALARAVNLVSRARPNEAAADSMRLLIDTVRIINEDDIDRLQAMARAVEGLSNVSFTQINLPDGSTISPIPDDVLTSLREYLALSRERQRTDAQTAQNAEALSVADRITLATVEALKNAFSKLPSVGLSAIYALGDALSKLVTGIRAVLHGINTVGSAIGKIAMNGIGMSAKALAAPFMSIGNVFAQTAKKAVELFNSLKRIAMYRMIRSALKAITEGFQEGRENLYQYSLIAGTEFAKSMDKAATSALYLKNSIGAATAPLTNYFVPILDSIVDRVVELINKFNEFTAALTGAATWTKALKYPKQWQDAAEDADKAAKKLKSTILGFDELNIIEPKSTANGSKAADALDYSKMFEEVQTDLTVHNKIPELLIPVKLAWDEEGEKTLLSIKGMFESILGLIRSIKDSFVTVWENGTGQKTLEITLGIVQEISRFIGAIASGIALAWDNADTGTHIIQNVWDIGNNLLKLTKDIWESLRLWAEGLDWTPLLTSFESLTATLSKITDENSAIGRGVRAFFTEVLEPIGSWTIETGLPMTIDALASALDSLDSAMNSLSKTDTFKTIADGLKNFTGFTANGAIGLLNAIAAALEIATKGDVSDNIAENLEQLYDSMLVFAGGKDSAVGRTMEGVKDQGIDYLGYQAYDYQQLGKAAKSVLFKELFGSDMDISSIPEWFGSSNNLVQDKFWNGLSNTITVFWTTIKSTISVGIDTVKEAFNEKIAEFIADIVVWWDKIKQAWDDSIGWIGDMWKEVWNSDVTFGDMKDWFIGVIAEFVASITKWWYDLSDGWDTLKEFPSTLWENIKTGFKQGWEDFKGGVELALADVVAWLTKNIFEPFINGIKKVFGIKNNSSTEMKQQGKNVSNGLLNGIKEPLAKIVSWLTTNVFQPFINGFKHLFGINSPSTVMKEQGSFVSEGLLEGIKSWFSLSKIKQWLKDNVYDKFVTGFKSVFGIGDDGSATGTKGIGESVVSGIESGVASQTASLVCKVAGLLSIFKKDEFKAAGTNVGEGIGEGIDESYATKIQPSTENLRNRVNRFFNRDDYKGSGSVIDQGIADGMSDMNTLRSTVGDAIWDMYANKFPDMFKKSDYEGFGRTIVEGISDGIKGSEGLLRAAVASLKIGDAGAAQVTLDSYTISMLGYASGGYPSTGELFIAREAGPELVGRFGSGTAVMNNSQIVEAVSNGVYRAAMAAVSQMPQASNRPIQNNIYLDRKELTKQIEQQQSSNGVPVFGNVVYT